MDKRIEANEKQIKKKNFDKVKVFKERIMMTILICKISTFSQFICEAISQKSLRLLLVNAAQINLESSDVKHLRLLLVLM